MLSALETGLFDTSGLSDEVNQLLVNYIKGNMIDFKWSALDFGDRKDEYDEFLSAVLNRGFFQQVGTKLVPTDEFMDFIKSRIYELQETILGDPRLVDAV